MSSISSGLCPNTKPVDTVKALCTQFCLRPVNLEKTRQCALDISRLRCDLECNLQRSPCNRGRLLINEEAVARGELGEVPR